MRIITNKLLIAFLVLASANLSAQIVTKGGDDGSDGTLRKEIQDAADGDIITFSSASASVTLTSEIVIDKNITISGESSMNLIDAAGNSRIFNIENANVLLENLKFKNGNADNGGAIYVNNSDVQINDSEFENNTASGASGSGGALAIMNDSYANIQNTSFLNNSASLEGGAIELNTGAFLALELSNISFDGNTAGNSNDNNGKGGAIHTNGNGDTMMYGGSITNNVSYSQGGGIWNDGGTVLLVGVTVTNNTASGNDSTEGGGGLFNNSGNLTIQTNTLIKNNSANGANGSGGGIYNNIGGTLSVSDSEISDNIASSYGGAIEDYSSSNGNDTTVEMFNVDILNNSLTNTTSNGGGIHMSGEGYIQVSESNISGNIAGVNGGGIYNGLGNLHLINTLVENNTANGNDSNNGGGGIYNDGGLVTLETETSIENNLANGNLASGGGLYSQGGEITVDYSSFRNNTAQQKGGAVWMDENTILNSTFATFDGNLTNNDAGGAIYNDKGEVHIEATTISRNESPISGGGLYNEDGIVELLRSTLAENNSGDHGGAIYNNGDLNMNAVTIAYNTSTNNGGGVMSNTTANIKNSIISDNTASLGIDASGTFTTQGFNVIGNDDEGTYVPNDSDYVNMSPDLGQLQDNGGPTETIAIAENSICVDAGDTLDVFKDQREFFLIDIRDIGAFEYGGTEEELDVEGAEKKAKMSTLYPNPSTGQININIDQSIAEDLNLKVFTMSGNLVYENSLMKGKNNFNLNSLSTGVYLVNISGGEQSQSHKLVIQ